MHMGMFFLVDVISHSPTSQSPTMTALDGRCGVQHSLGISNSTIRTFLPMCILYVYLHSHSFEVVYYYYVKVHYLVDFKHGEGALRATPVCSRSSTKA